MDRETIINLPKKIFKFYITVTLAEKTVKTAARIYRFVPRFDKITGIDTDKLVNRHMSK